MKRAVVVLLAVALLQTDAAHGVSHAPLRCDPGTAAAQLEMFKSRPTKISGCSDHSWLKHVRALTGHGPRTMIDIGCNKGLASSEWFHMWVPELGINKVSLRNVMVAQHLARGGNPAVTLCHFCDETVTADGRVVPTKACTEVQHDLGFLAHGLGDLSPGSTQQPRHLTVHCIEPSDINFLRLDEAGIDAPCGIPARRQVWRASHPHHVRRSGGYLAYAQCGWLSQAGPLSRPVPSDSPLQQQSSKAHGYPARQPGVRSSPAAGKTGLVSAGKAIREGKAGRAGKIHRRQAQGEAGSQAVAGSPAGPAGVMVSPTPSPVEDATYKVKVWTVDKLMQDVVGANTSVLLLKIDTEGWDGLVLQGASGALERKLVDFIIFEYHSVGKWRTTLLADVVTWMEQKGYACYFDSQPDIFKLSAGCWLPGYEVHQWSNVACGRAGHWPESILDQSSYLRQLTMAAPK